MPSCDIYTADITPPPPPQQGWRGALLVDNILQRIDEHDPDRWVAYALAEWDRLAHAADGQFHVRATGRYLARGRGLDHKWQAADRARRDLADAIGAQLVPITEMPGCGQLRDASGVRIDQREKVILLTVEQRVAVQDAAWVVRQRKGVPENALIGEGSRREHAEPKVVGRLGHHRGTVHCPCHDDRHPSLSIFVGRHGDTLGRCHAAGCGVLLRIGPDGTARQLRGAAAPYQDQHSTTRAPRSRRSQWQAPRSRRPQWQGRPMRIVAERRVHPGLAPFDAERVQWVQHAEEIAPDEAPAHRLARELLGELDRNRRDRSLIALGARNAADRYRSVGYRARTLDDRDEEGRWRRTWSAVAGMDTALVDIDHLGDLGAVPDHQLEEALRWVPVVIPRVCPFGVQRVEVVRTSRDGLQLHLLLREHVPDEQAWYDQHREHLRELAAFVLGQLRRAGLAVPSAVVDESSWAPGRMRRCCGWRLRDRVSDEPWLVRPLWLGRLRALVSSDEDRRCRAA